MSGAPAVASPRTPRTPRAPRPVVAAPRALRRRRALAWTAASAIVLLAALGTLTLGEAGIAPGDALAALVGLGEPGDVRVVQGWRLPRAVLGAAIGILLAWSGALFQIVTRNPLGSPDVLGFSTGAMTGVLFVMASGSAGVAALTGSAFAGGLVAAVLVFALSARSGARGYAIVVTGIAVTAVLGAVNTILIIRFDDFVARSAALWATGSLNGVDGAWVAPALAAVALGGILLAWLAPALQAHEFGEERAATLGARPLATRWAAMVLGIALLAVATAVTGPIAFVALAAPQLARVVWRSGTVPLAASGAVGAALLSASDLLSARLFAPAVLPTGLITLCIGGVYLAWMLTRSKGRS
ncbi:iron chelate uptake ABC transporter family permease subunit [Agromyces mediolanus]|uniref:FecCD family ABC transporter permease n=1 Tax=Agromyces mediolanus TaxID=41986 RepID=UPI003836DCA5